MSIRKNLEAVQERIQRACRRAGRNPAEVRLVLVTKNVSVERMGEAYETGTRDFGENRVQELLAKKLKLPADIRWHFVGHLQTNKVKSVLGEIHWLHSLDRIALAEEIQKQAEKRNLTVEALIQVNTSGEATKSGFTASEAPEAIETIAKLNRIRLRGLMTIGPLTEKEAVIREGFRQLRHLRDELKLEHLSMGMSSDFEIAIEEGATMVRIGTAVFGERK